MNSPHFDQPDLGLTTLVAPHKLCPGMTMLAPEYSAPRTIASITPHDAGNDFDYWFIKYQGGGGRAWPNRNARIYL